ncbi:MAG: hypothetical protein ACOX65_00515, partial [Anaerotruncus rubiinfantis]
GHPAQRPAVHRGLERLISRPEAQALGDHERLAGFMGRVYVPADFDTNRKSLLGAEVPKKA